ncbi:MAG: class I SAM-dependent methyltransferase [Deltaproteobacteria bacterium]|nr:MAG: class I SAM-dependent methyltransferase [Deltaproteobacteria bacterium]
MRDLGHVQTNFEKQASIYDDCITKLIPKYREQNELIPKLIPFDRERGLSAIDLGCGTGILAYLILQRYPKARVIAFDLAGNMLEECKKNLAGFEKRLILKKGDFGIDDFGSGYDIAVSGLSIHHLDSVTKRRLYQRIYRALSPGGIFINRDIVLGKTPVLTEEYHERWRDYMRSCGEDGKMWFNKYLEQDTPDSAEDQMEWLKEAGFTEVECYWRYINFAIFGGRKAG